MAGALNGNQYRAFRYLCGKDTDFEGEGAVSLLEPDLEGRWRHYFAALKGMSAANTTIDLDGGQGRD